MSLTTEISIKWHAEDIQQCAKGFDNSLEDLLTPEECSKVLDYLEYHHDATIGINWDVIDDAIIQVTGNWRINNEGKRCNKSAKNL